VQPKAAVEPFLVSIETVRVLHDELARADQAGAWPWLVTILGLDVVQQLREVAVRPNLARVERHRLLMGHREHEVPVVAVCELEDLWDVVAAGCLPELGRRQDGHQQLLRADRVHLLANDLRDLPVNAPAEREERPDARADLPHEAAAYEQPVACRVGVGGILTQRREEELRGAGYWHLVQWNQGRFGHR
jgi:hypothetical protein